LESVGGLEGGDDDEDDDFTPEAFQKIMKEAGIEIP